MFQVSLVNLQAKVGYALIGIAGEKLLKQLGYPHMSVIVLLHRILDMAGIKVCTPLPNEHIYMFIFFANLAIPVELRTIHLLVEMFFLKYSTIEYWIAQLTPIDLLSSF